MLVVEHDDGEEGEDNDSNRLQPKSGLELSETLWLWLKAKPKPAN